MKTYTAEQIADTRKYITNALNRTELRRNTAAKLTEYSNGTKPLPHTYDTYLSTWKGNLSYRDSGKFYDATAEKIYRAFEKALGANQMFGYQECFCQYIEDEIYGEGEWGAPEPYPAHLDHDIVWYLRPLFIEKYDPDYTEEIIEELLKDLPEADRDDAHRNALRIVKALYDYLSSSRTPCVHMDKLIID